MAGETSPARSDSHSSPTSLQSVAGYIPHLKSQFKMYEDAFFTRVKDELITAKEHPIAACGVATTLGLLLMRGPRRFLLRHTIGRFQSEEAQFLKAEKNVKELNLSIELMKKESQKLLERAALAEKDMARGHMNLMNAGKEVQHVVNSAYKVESQAAGLMDLLREIPGREALKLRAEVVSMTSLLEQQSSAMQARIVKISDSGIHV